jgi:hypothetical protein
VDFIWLQRLLDEARLPRLPSNVVELLNRRTPMALVVGDLLGEREGDLLGREDEGDFDGCERAGEREGLDTDGEYVGALKGGFCGDAVGPAVARPQTQAIVACSVLHAPLLPVYHVAVADDVEPNSMLSDADDDVHCVQLLGESLPVAPQAVRMLG